MFYPKKLLLKKMNNYKLTYTAFANGMNCEIDDNLLPLKYGKVVYNYTVKNGALKNGLGFELATFPKKYNDGSERTILTLPNGEGIKALWHFKYYDLSAKETRHKIVFSTKSKHIYFFQTVAQGTAFFDMFFDEKTFDGDLLGINYHLNGDDCLIIIVPNEQKIIVFHSYDGTEIIENAPQLVSICLHYERLFAILEGDRKTLMFSANLDPTDWDVSLDAGGFIEMHDERGSINKIISFNDYVYVFRDYGVSKVSAYGDQSEFSVSQLFISSSKIYGNSVTSCGDRIIFLARDGLHSFDGYSTNRITLNIESMFENINNEKCCSVFYNNKYYLACRLDFGDDQLIGCEAYEEGYTNNALIELDLNTGEINLLRGVDILSMIAVEEDKFSKLIACFNGEHGNKFGQLTHDGKIFGQILKKEWISPFSNLGYPNQVKIVKEVLIKTKSDCIIKIKTDKEEKQYLVRGSETTQRVKTNVRGEMVQISFITETEGDVEISAPQLVIGVVAWVIWNINLKFCVEKNITKKS